jgi:small GTP-binding protein
MLSTQYTLNGLIIGDPGTGKTAFITRYTKNIFDYSSSPTIGIDYNMKIVNINDLNIRLQLYDSSGTDRFQPLTTSYYRQADFIILAYDVTNKASFLHLTKWLERIKQHAKPSIPIILIGTKIDLKFSRQTSFDEVLQFTEENKMEYVEVSAKSGVNIENSLNTIIENCINCLIEEGEQIILEPSDTKKCRCYS